MFWMRNQLRSGLTVGTGARVPIQGCVMKNEEVGSLASKNAIKWACLKTAYSIPSHRFSPSYPSRSNQWSFQEPKLEVPKIYNAYFSDLCKGISPQNMARNMVQYLRFRILKLPSRSRYGTKKWWYQLPNPISTPVSRIQTQKRWNPSGQKSCDTWPCFLPTSTHYHMIVWGIVWLGKNIWMMKLE